MFTIQDGRSNFYQWDLNRKLIVEDSTIKQVHFSNCLCVEARVCETYTEDNKTLVDVPNALLQEYLDINVYGYDGEATKHCATFGVIKRTKPADYIYTDEEVNALEEVKADIYRNGLAVEGYHNGVEPILDIAAYTVPKSIAADMDTDIYYDEERSFNNPTELVNFDRVVFKAYSDEELNGEVIVNYPGIVNGSFDLMQGSFTGKIVRNVDNTKLTKVEENGKYYYTTTASEQGWEEPPKYGDSQAKCNVALTRKAIDFKYKEGFLISGGLFIFWCNNGGEMPQDTEIKVQYSVTGLKDIFTPIKIEAKPKDTIFQIRITEPTGYLWHPGDYHIQYYKPLKNEIWNLTESIDFLWGELEYMNERINALEGGTEYTLRKGGSEE